MNEIILADLHLNGYDWANADCASGYLEAITDPPLSPPPTFKLYPTNSTQNISSATLKISPGTTQLPIGVIVRLRSSSEIVKRATSLVLYDMNFPAPSS